MPTLYISHSAFLDHDTGFGHPERADRLRAIEKVLEHEMYQFLWRADAPEAPIEAIEKFHPRQYIEAIQRAIPEKGHAHADSDTVLSPKSWPAILRAVGGAIHAVDKVMSGEVRNAFCAIRPPGHHAEPTQAMGFCFFNNAAIAAEHARAAYGAERVAVVDFDVHHGNGTQKMFWSDKDLFYASTHQMPLFPGTGDLHEEGEARNIVNAPLRSGDDGYHFREAFESRILPGLHRFSPDLLIISAGFDAHRDDPLAGIGLTESDFAWATQKLMDVAEKHADGRVISLLEGGYNLAALAKSVGVHVRILMERAS